MIECRFRIGACRSQLRRPAVMSCSLGLAIPKLASPKHSISLTAPLTARSLASIRGALASASPHAPSSSSRQDLSFENTSTGAEINAAVLVPLANVGDVPGVLLEVRGALRTHAGEVR